MFHTSSSSYSICESRFDAGSFAQPFLLHLASLGVWKGSLAAVVSDSELLQQSLDT